MLAKSLIRFALLLLGLSLAGPSAALYTLKAVPGSAQLEVTMLIPPGKVVRLALRGSDWGLQEQVESPRCGDQALARDAQGVWDVPPGCREVSWRVRPERIEHGQADASRQASLALRSPDWILLSEPTSLLRPVDDGGDEFLESELRLVGATERSPGRWKLPAMNKAPEFFALGDFHESSVEIGGRQIHHVIDDPERLARTGLLGLHEQALAFLAQRLPLPLDLPAQERGLLVIWLGIKPGSGEIGGAAGGHSFVTNYLIPDGKGGALRRAEPLMTLAHEQFHQLADQIRGNRPALPVWLNESLAQYYALKTLRTILPGPETDRIVAHFITPGRITENLLSLDRRNRAHDPSAYPLIYQQGASFWAEFDEALQQGTQHRIGLDQLLVELLTAGIPSDGSLPPAFVAKAAAQGGARISELVSRHVSSEE